MDKKLKQAYGNWVEGDRFWDRENDIELLIERIEGGAHIVLVAQRRMGKTSLLREISRRLQEKYICLFVDLQRASDSPDAMVELSLAMKPYKSLWDKTKSVFSNITSTIIENIEKINIKDIGITLRAGLTAGNWKEKGDQLFSSIASEERPVLLLMDEVPVMVNRMLKGENFTITPQSKTAVDEFMSWLRDNSLRHQNKIRIIVSEYLSTNDKSPVVYNSFARALYTHGDRNLLGHAEAWARKAVALDPGNPIYHHTLACTLAVTNRGQEALDPAQDYLDKTESAERSVPDTIELFIGLAAAGCAKEAVEMLENSRSVCIVEPLLVGLRLFIGEDVKAAVEIMEVAKDVVARIKVRQQKLMQADNPGGFEK